METSTGEYVILPGGVHLWDPDPVHLGAAPPAEVIARKTAAYTQRNLDTPGWKILEGRRVVITGDVPDEALQIMAVTAEELDRMLYQQIGGPEKSLYQYKIRIFSKSADFCRYARACGAANALSLYAPMSKEMALHFGPEVDPEEFELTFAHEFVHAWMDGIWRVTEPLWFAEGMAEYFSNLRWTASGYRPTKKNIRGVMHLGIEEHLNLNEILNARRDLIYGMRFPLYYAQSWALVRFLLDRHPEIVEKLLERKKPDLAHLSEEYAEYLGRL